MTEADRAAKAACTRFLPMHVPEAPGQTLRRLAAMDAAAEPADTYGDSGAVTRLERRCAELLAKPAARFFIKGMMAQACAMTVHAEARRTRNIVIHAKSHIALDEADSIERVAGLTTIRLGSSDPFTVADLKAVTEPIGAVVVELPLRRSGFLLPPLDDLRAISAWCRGQGVPLHFDGARLWEAAAAYDLPLADLAALADSVYVSFYKGLGGLGGAMLLGDPAFMAATEVWKHRHSGNVFTVFPYALSALDGMDRYLPRMGDFVARAKALAEALADIPGLIVNPATPHAHAFQLIARGDPADFAERNRQFAHEHGVWLFNAFAPAPLHGHTLMEINIGDASDHWSVDEARDWLRAFFRADG